VIAGSEDAVAQALVARAAGGTGFASGAGLGRQLSRIDIGSKNAWMEDLRKSAEVTSNAARETRLVPTNQSRILANSDFIPRRCPPGRG
jgi:hypothetical protein